MFICILIACGGGTKDTVAQWAIFTKIIITFPI